VTFEHITPATLREAVRIYLEEAYPDGAVPAEVRQRLEWPEAASLAELVQGGPFERIPPDAAMENCEHIGIRLGNRRYPHMKLGVDRIPQTDDWVLAVECHDRDVVAEIPQEEREAFEALFRHNAALKARIERRWTEAGLPTFERYVRERLSRRRGGK